MLCITSHCSRNHKVLLLRAGWNPVCPPIPSATHAIQCCPPWSIRTCSTRGRGCHENVWSMAKDIAIKTPWFLIVVAQLGLTTNRRVNPYPACSSGRWLPRADKLRGRTGDGPEKRLNRYPRTSPSLEASSKGTSPTVGCSPSARKDKRGQGPWLLQRMKAWIPTLKFWLSDWQKPSVSRTGLVYEIDRQAYTDPYAVDWFVVPPPRPCQHSLLINPNRQPTNRPSRCKLIWTSWSFWTPRCRRQGRSQLM